MEEDISIKNILIDLWDKKVIIIVVTIICALVGAIYGMSKSSTQGLLSDADNVYLASSEFRFVKYENSDREIQTENDSYLVTNKNKTSAFSDYDYAYLNEVVYSSDTLNEINDIYGLDLSKSEWKSLVSFSMIEDSDILQLKFKYVDDEIAINVVDDVIQILNDVFESVYNSESYDISLITIDSTSASTTSVSSDSNVIKYFVVFAIIGFIGICVVIFIIFILAEKVYDRDELEKNLKLKNFVELSNTDNDDAIKLLRINLENAHQILLTSAKKELKYDVGINLAKSYAELNKKVLYLDLKNETINLIDKFNGKGLIDYLASNDKFPEKYACETGIQNLSILTYGSNLNNAIELLESNKMKDTLNALSEFFDVIIINSDDVLDSPKSLIMSKYVEYTILAVDNKHDKMADVVRAKNNITDVGGNVIGTILFK